MSPKHLARMRQADIAPDRLKESQAEGFLQLPNLHGDSGLGHKQISGSLGYRFLACNFQERLKLLKGVGTHAGNCRGFVALEKADGFFTKGDWSLLNWRIKVNPWLLMCVTKFSKQMRKECMPKALIFDGDGTLADSESAHRAAFKPAAQLGWPQ
jgi:hypothetical protein